LGHSLDRNATWQTKLAERNGPKNKRPFRDFGPTPVLAPRVDLIKIEKQRSRQQPCKQELSVSPTFPNFQMQNEQRLRPAQEGQAVCCSQFLVAGGCMFDEFRNGSNYMQHVESESMRSCMLWTSVRFEQNRALNPADATHSSGS